MEIIAKQSYVRGSVQKLTEVSRVIKHMKVTAMRTQLSQMNKDAARRILETLNQAVANAQHNYGISEDKLMLKELLILRGPHYKRMRPVSRGQGHAILKRTSHISITLSSIEPKVEKAVEEKVEQKSASTTETKKTVTKKPTVKKVVKAKTE